MQLDQKIAAVHSRPCNGMVESERELMLPNIDVTRINLFLN